MTKSVLVVGSGAREHAIIDKLSNSKNITTIYIFSNQDNIDLYLNNNACEIKCISHFNIDNDDNLFSNTINYIRDNSIDFVFIGPEKYLCDGIVNILNYNCIPSFGPDEFASQIESSKIFSKQIMKELNIPTATFKYFENSKSAIQHILDLKDGSYVIKVDGLASGKGVFLPNKHNEAISIIVELFNNDPTTKIIIEEKLIGTEVSLLAFCNGSTVELMPCVQDYKLSRDNNTGTNTGGMGSHGPVYTLNNTNLALCKTYMESVVLKLNYVGVLYMGLMVSDKSENNINVLEFNCRFGDPETQVLMNLLDSDLFDILTSCYYRTSFPKIVWNNYYVSNVVFTHLDYPNTKLVTPTRITGINSIDDSIKLYFANVTIKQGEYYTTGGRILSVVSKSTNFFQSINNIYNNINRIELEDNKRYYRMDIGYNYFTATTSNTRKIKIAVMGSTNGTSMEYLVNEIKNNNIKDASIELVVSNVNSAGILEKAKVNKISNLYISSKNMDPYDYDSKICNIFKVYEIDYIFLIGYMRIVSSAILDLYKNRVFNIHPSLLPRYSGEMNLNIYDQVIKNKDFITGCTLHNVTEVVDSGKIILQKQHVINNENSIQLKQTVQELEKQCIVDCVTMITNNIINHKTTYSDSGVNIESGEKFVDIIKELKKSSNQDKNIGNFCSINKIPDSDLLIATSTDGVGTKIDLQNKYHCLEMAGQDLVAMCVNDLICHGAMPHYFLDYIASEKLDMHKSKDLLNGILKGCEEADCELVGGETAEMKNVYFRNGMDIAGFTVGFVSQNNILPKQGISSGDIILGLKSSGLHANGFSLIYELNKNKELPETTWKNLLTPTKIYVRDIKKLLACPCKDSIKAIANITGGGMFKNIPRVLPDNLSFELINYDIPHLYHEIKELSQLSWYEMHETFNCGIGMVLIVDSTSNINYLVDNYNLIHIGNVTNK
jgi:formyltetrahydrofolate-dependent phosphoribosylglycinamide formyltransferase